MTSYEEIKQEIKLEIEQGQSLEEIAERSYELVDNLVPVYNNRIVEEWQSMPSDYDNRGAQELGHNCEEINIINLMMSDLYIYYTELVGLVINDLAQELAGAE